MTTETVEPLLSVWVIFDHPRDCPDMFIARRFTIRPHHVDPTEDVLRAATLDPLREMFMRRGFVRFARDPRDDAKIVESWM